MQLDVEESTPASEVTDWFHSRIAIGNCYHAITCNIFYPYLSESNLPPMILLVWPVSWFSDILSSMKSALVTLSSKNYGLVTDIQKARHKSPPCISTGVLKKYCPFSYLYIHIIDALFNLIRLCHHIINCIVEATEIWSTRHSTRHVAKYVINLIREGL